MAPCFPTESAPAARRRDRDDAPLTGCADAAEIQADRAGGGTGDGRSRDARKSGADRLLLGLRSRHRPHLVQRLIPESPEDAEGFGRRDPDQAKAARPIRMKAMAATPRMRANAARCRRTKTP